MANNKIVELLGADAEMLLNHKCETFPAAALHAPGPDHIDNVFGVFQ